MPPRPVVIGCLAAVCLPFVAGALTLFGAAVVKASQGDLGTAVASALGALIAGAVPVSLVAAAFLVDRARADDKLKEQRRAEEPRPWRWRREWTEGRVEFRVPGLARFVIWGFALVWNLIVLGAGAGVLALGGSGGQQTGALVFLLLFLAAGAFLISLAWQTSASHRRFGRSAFEMARIPFALGGRVEGWVRAPATLREASTVRVTLDCVNVPRMSDSSDRVLWRDQVTLTSGAVETGPTETRIPVSLAVPSDQPPSHDRDLPGDHIEWRVTVEADLPGVDYRAAFDVPVFPASVEAVAGPVSSPGPSAVSEAYARDAQAAQRAASTRFRLEALPDGAAIHFPAPGWLAGWTIGPLLLIPLAAAATRLPALKDVPAWVVIGIAAGVTGFLLLITAFGVLTHPRRIEVRPGRIVIRRGAYGIGWDRTIPKGEVTDIVAEPLRNGPRIDWTVDIKAGSKSYNAALGLRDLGEARWLVAELQRLMAEHGAA